MTTSPGDSTGEAAMHRAGGKRYLAIGVAVAAVLGLTGVSAWLWRGTAGGSPGAATSPGPVRTVEIIRTDLANTLTMSGTLGYGMEQPVKGQAGGRVTWLPTSGGTVSRGGQLMRVDDRQVTLFYGATPMFRRLDTPNQVGRDVAVVADNLKALGYAIGRQPAVGTVVPAPAGSAAPGGTATPPSTGGSVKVRTGDAVLTTALITAIKRWQTQIGLPPSGTLDVGDVIVLPGEIRVGTVTAQLGDDAAANLFSVSPTVKSVTVGANAAEVGAVAVAAKVTVTLPDSSTTTGTVATISRSAQNNGDPNPAASTQVTVVIALDDPAATGNLDAGSVRVEFTAEVRHGVLAVPVGALLALSGGGYALQLTDGRLVAVTTGLFAKGMVEISGAGATEGTRVVTTS